MQKKTGATRRGRKRSVKPAAAAEAAAAIDDGNSVRTLAVDIGGSGVKVMVLGDDGTPLTERTRRDTPQPAKPKPIVDVIVELAKTQGDFNRVSVGFPGVVHDGVVHTAPNLDPE